MLGRDDAGYDVRIVLRAYSPDELPQTQCYRSLQDRIAVLGDPDDMDFEVIQTMR